MDPVQAVQNARPWGEVLISLAQTVGTQIVIMFLIDRAAKIIEQAMKRRDLSETVGASDLYGPRPIRLVVASSAEGSTTPPQEDSTGSNTPSAS